MALPHIDTRTDLFDEAETWSLDRMRTEQLARLQETVKRAYAGVPHYRAQLEAAGSDPRTSRR